MNNMSDFCGVSVRGDTDSVNLDDVIEEMEEFIIKFSTHSMSDHLLFLRGKKEAYLDVIEYLKRVSPTDYEDRD